jgi:hypothetical protein
MPDDKNNDGGNAFSPFLFIPYYPGDAGARPLPPGVSTCDCPGIKFDGLPAFAHGPFIVGQAIGVSAAVANLGGVGGLVRISFFWGDPSTAFTAQTLQLIGTLTEYRAAGQTADTQPWPWIPPANIPGHACVVVEVSAPLDPAPGTFSPADRHYAQQNLNFVVPGGDGNAHVRFQVANPWAGARAVVLRARPMPDALLEKLKGQLRKDPVPVDPETVQLAVAGKDPRPGSLRFGLAGQQSRLCEATLPLPNPLRDDQFVACVVEQLDPANADLIVGALAVVVSAQRV